MPPLPLMMKNNSCTSCEGGFSSGTKTSIAATYASSTVPISARTGKTLSRDKFVPYAANSLNVSRLRGVGFDFLTQPPDVDGHGTIVAIEIVTPHLID